MAEGGLDTSKPGRASCTSTLKQTIMQVARALLLATLCCSLACGAAAWSRGPTAAFKLFCNTRWGSWRHARLLAGATAPPCRRRRRCAHSLVLPLALPPPSALSMGWTSPTGGSAWKGMSCLQSAKATTLMCRRHGCR